MKTHWLGLVAALALALGGCRQALSASAPVGSEPGAGSCELPSGSTPATPATPQEGKSVSETDVPRSDAEWRQRLTPEQYRLLRQAGTERAGTGQYLYTKEPGVYRCAGCGAELFKSDTKFDSGSGWPSFWAAAAQDRVKLVEDTSYGMRRVEVRCARCDGHLGHVFEDVPTPTRQRF